MPYWIHEDGDVVGPMKAIDVLRRARPSTQVSDGENWFRLDEGRGGDSASGDRAAANTEAATSSEAVG